jgi:hypothetical protein
MAPAVPRRLHPDFCNKIGTKRTCRSGLAMSAVEGTTDVPCERGHEFDPKDIGEHFHIPYLNR